MNTWFLDQSPENITFLQKSQTVRLIDVFALGPFMIWFGLKSDAPDWARYIMIGSGVATIIYNGNNYIHNLRREGMNV